MNIFQSSSSPFLLIFFLIYDIKLFFGAGQFIKTSEGKYKNAQTEPGVPADVKESGSAYRTKC